MLARFFLDVGIRRLDFDSTQRAENLMDSARIEGSKDTFKGTKETIKVALGARSG
jgi:hypothetical protein